MNGILYGVSVGPGDPELMTLKAVRIIKNCEVIAVPRTKKENALALEIARQSCDISDKEILYLDFLMSKDRDLLNRQHQKIAAQLYPYLKKGKSIAFLNIGDVSVYSTFSYIAELVENKGFDVEICAGVTSFCAVAAKVKSPLVQGKNPLIILPSNCADFDYLLDCDGTKVIMKSGSSTAAIKNKLAERNLNNTYAVCNCGHSDETIHPNLDSIPDECGYFTTIVSIKDNDNSRKST